MNQLFAAFALASGEILIIGIEMWAARHFNQSDPWATIMPAFLISLLGVVLLVYGYVVGYQLFKNIWIVTAISIASIVVVEPIIAWILFHEVPTLGASIALVLGIIGMAVSILVK